MTTDTETTALILSGSGYDIEIAPDAIARRDELITAATTIAAVHDNDESAVAARHVRSLAALRIEVEKQRKAIKEPVLAVGKRIDTAAKEYLTSVEIEENRLKKLIGDHAAEVARIKAEKEAEERRIAEEARRAREAAESAAAAAETTGKIADVIAAKQAERERQEALAARMAASADVASTNVAQGVRFAWDFEVDDIEHVFRMAPAFVTMEIKRSAVLKWFREMESANEDVEPRSLAIGIRAFKKPVVSTK